MPANLQAYRLRKFSLITERSSIIATRLKQMDEIFQATVGCVAARVLRPRAVTAIPSLGIQEGTMTASRWLTYQSTAPATKTKLPSQNCIAQDTRGRQCVAPAPSIHQQAAFETIEL